MTRGTRAGWDGRSAGAVIPNGFEESLERPSPAPSGGSESERGLDRPGFYRTGLRLSRDRPDRPPHPDRRDRGISSRPRRGECQESTATLGGGPRRVNKKLTNPRGGERPGRQRRDG